MNISTTDEDGSVIDGAMYCNWCRFIVGICDWSSSKEHYPNNPENKRVMNFHWEWQNVSKTNEHRKWWGLDIWGIDGFDCSLK